eukprot:NODE_292_length_10587_cov_0.520881.p2 type:complete len:757 gc:universal NODE_292_length_10587_cov_0.520881:3252-982(-)
MEQPALPESLTLSDKKTTVIKDNLLKRRTLFSTDKKEGDNGLVLGLIPMSWIDIAKNHALIGALVLGCYICSFFNHGFIGMVAVGFFVAQFLQISIDRTKRNMRVEFEKAFNLEIINFQNEEGGWTNGERVEWLNALIEKYWGMFEPVLSEIIVGVIDPYLELYKPSFLDDLRFKEFSLGSTGVRINTVETNTDVEDDIIYLVFNVVYAPVENNSDANSNILLEIRLGKGIASTAIPVSVKDTYFRGRLHCRIKLMTKFPHVKVVEIWFETLPEIDFVLKPLGNLSMDVMNLPGIKQSIQMIINMIMNTILVAPVRMPIDVDAILNGVVQSGPVGVLKVHLIEGKNFKNTEIIGKSDPYCDILLNGRLVASTDVFENNLNPHFDELKFILIYDLNLDKISFDVKDHDQVGFKTVGKADFQLLEHVDDNQLIDKELTLFNNKDERGQIVFDSFWYPVCEPNKELPIRSGILRVTIHKCKHIQGEIKSLSGSYNPYLEIKFNGDSVFKSKTKKRTNNPRFEETADVFVPNRNSGKLFIAIKDQRDLAADPIIGSKEFNTSYIIDKKAGRQDWYELNDAVSGKMLITFEWKPIYLSESELSTVIPAKCVAKIRVLRCKNLKNQELSGTSDPYCVVKCNTRSVGKTLVVENSLNPEFDETFFIPIRTFKEKLAIELYDYNQMTKDKHMGSAFLNVFQDGVSSPDDSAPKISLDSRITQSQPFDVLLSDKRVGQIYMECELFPLATEYENSSVIGNFGIIY